MHKRLLQLKKKLRLSKYCHEEEMQLVLHSVCSKFSTGREDTKPLPSGSTDGPQLRIASKFQPSAQTKNIMGQVINALEWIRKNVI